MTRPRAPEALLLVLVAASVLLGGGLGCEPQLEGTSLRVSSLLLDPNDKNGPRDWYLGITGKKAPGNVWAELPYPLVPSFGVGARMGVFLDDALADSVGAEGCVGLRDEANASHEFRLCVTYQLSPAKTLVYSNLDGLTADCLGASKADLSLMDDGATLTAQYRCPGAGSFTSLTTRASEYDAGERWLAFAGAYNVPSGVQIGFDDFDVDTGGAFDGSLEAQVALSSFRGWKHGVDAFYELEDEDLGGAQIAASLALGYLGTSYQQTVNNDLFPDTDAAKLATKAFMSYGKLYDGLFLGKESKYFKSFPKLADTEVCALEAMPLPF